MQSLPTCGNMPDSMDPLVERFRSDVANGPRGRIAEIASATGITLKTLQNLRYGVTQTMGHEHMRKLQAFYELQGPPPAPHAATWPAPSP